MVLKEFQRLKELEESTNKWDLRRYISKVNYKLQTDAVKEVLVPLRNLAKNKEGWIYAEEADLIYIAMFGYTSKKWREDNPELAKKGYNLRDVANTHQLIILSNLESLNSAMINAGQTDKYQRLQILRKESIHQIKALKSSSELEHELIDSPRLAQQKTLLETNHIDKPEKQTPDLSSLNLSLKGKFNDSSKKSVDPPNNSELF